MYCILTKYKVADQMLQFGGSHTFLSGSMATTKKLANLDIWWWLGRLYQYGCRTTLHDNQQSVTGLATVTTNWYPEYVLDYCNYF